MREPGSSLPRSAVRSIRPLVATLKSLKFLLPEILTGRSTSTVRKAHATREFWMPPATGGESASGPNVQLIDVSPGGLTTTIYGGTGDSIVEKFNSMTDPSYAPHVDFSPWLHTGNNLTAPVTQPGFIGDFSELHVSPDSQKAAPLVGWIDEALLLKVAHPGIQQLQTLHLEAGTYSDQTVL